jgi:hypothetical protein
MIAAPEQVVRRMISELLGAVNYWIRKDGQPFQVSNHADFAVKTTGIKFTRLSQDSNRYWQEQGKAYTEMFKRGWMRVSLFGGDHLIKVDFRGAMSQAQLNWLADEAFARQARVVTDNDRTILDFTETRSMEESADHVVSAMLGT